MTSRSATRSSMSSKFLVFIYEARSESFQKYSLSHMHCVFENFVTLPFHFSLHIGSRHSSISSTCSDVMETRVSFDSKRKMSHFPKVLGRKCSRAHWHSYPITSSDQVLAVNLSTFLSSRAANSFNNFDNLVQFACEPYTMIACVLTWPIQYFVGLKFTIYQDNSHLIFAGYSAVE